MAAVDGGSSERGLHFIQPRRLRIADMTKSAIIERIGEDGLLLPELIGRALGAHDRLTYYFSLLQTARAYATAPAGEQVSSLRAERVASGVTDSSLDQIVEATSPIGPKAFHIPRAGTIIEHLFEELRL